MPKVPITNGILRVDTPLITDLQPVCLHPFIHNKVYPEQLASERIYTMFSELYPGLN